MVDATEDSSSPPDRVICPSCGGEQERPSSPHLQRCVICGESLLAAPAERPPSKRNNALTEVAEALSRQTPPSGPAPEVSALLNAEKRLTSMLAFIPVWGLLRLSRSEQHTRAERSLLALASLGVTMLLGLGILMIMPTAKERADETRARIRQQIDVLGRLVEEYGREHGALPDEPAWQRSAASADLRFYDPWGRAYHYTPSGDGFVIASYGRDDAPGGDGEDGDVSVDFPPPTTSSVDMEQ